MKEITIWHNPKCSKSRAAMDILTQNGCDAHVVRYLEEAPNKESIKKVLKMLGVAPRELMRTNEELYKELHLKEEQEDEALIDAMAQHPKLIERPIIIKGDKAIIGRPSERIEAFLKS